MKYISFVRAFVAPTLIATTMVFVGCPDSGGGNGDTSAAKYICTNGTPASGNPAGNADVAQCSSCENTYKLVNNGCTPTAYICTNGTPASGNPAGNADVAQCQSCNGGYALNSNILCAYSSKDFDTLASADNTNPRGIWSDGTTMWVADYIDDKIYAYSMATKARDSAKDFNHAYRGVQQSSSRHLVRRYYYVGSGLHRRKNLRL